MFSTVANICISRMRVLSKLIFPSYQQPFDLNNFLLKNENICKEKACLRVIFLAVRVISFFTFANYLLILKLCKYQIEKTSILDLQIVHKY